MTGSSNKVQQWLTLGLPFPLIVVNGWLALQVFHYFQPLVTVFGLAALLAFMLNYPVQFFQQRGLQRKYAIIIVFLLGSLILIIFGITLIPILLEQLAESAKLLPTWIDSGNQKLQTIDNWAANYNLPINLSQLVTQLTDRLPDELQSLAEEFLTLALGTLDSVSEVALTIVLAFYLLIDSQRLWHNLFQRLPSRFGTSIQESIQQNFQNYFKGQIALATLVGFSMTLGFLALSVPFGLIFGLAIGFMTLIPFGDVLSFSLVSLLVASHDLMLGVKTFAVAIVIDQIIDQAIAPRLLGGFTGLSPIGVLAALAVGTKVGGLLGLLTAVPLASCFKSFLDIWQVDADNTTNTIKLAPVQSEKIISNS